MKRPSFQFYPGDWQSNSNLRRCTHAERGAWIDVMCLLHDQAEYGQLRWSLKEIAQAIGAPIALLKGLVAKGVLKGGDANVSEPFIYTPRSGRKDGEPVTLVPTQAGPLWYSSRMVKDEYVRTNAGASTRFGSSKGERDLPPEHEAKEETERARLRQRVLEKTGGVCYHCNASLKGVWEIDHLMPRSKGGRHTFSNMVPSCQRCNQDKSDTLPDDWAALRHSPSRRRGECQGDNQGDGSSSSSSSSSVISVPIGTGADAPQTLSQSQVWKAGIELLAAQGMGENQARAFIGKLKKELGGGTSALSDLVEAAVAEQPADARAWLQAAVKRRKAEKPMEAAQPDWALKAGFGNRWEAESAGCFASNAAEFADGKRREVAA